MLQIQDVIRWREDGWRVRVEQTPDGHRPQLTHVDAPHRRTSHRVKQEVASVGQEGGPAMPRLPWGKPGGRYEW